jgi:anti-sigma regulatory factor (Ser/Thr protein kinase)
MVSPPKRRVFPGEDGQVAIARRFVARALEGCPVTDTAALLTSELVTNTLRHTHTADGGTFDVIVWRGLAAACVAVLDDGSHATPAVRVPASGEPAESGYGLALVDRLATRWGYRTYEGEESRGTAVWFCLRWAAT